MKKIPDKFKKKFYSQDHEAHDALEAEFNEWLDQQQVADDWHTWFAWYPVCLRSGKWVWWQWVERHGIAPLGRAGKIKVRWICREIRTEGNYETPGT